MKIKTRLHNIILVVILLVTFFYHYSGLNKLVDNDETTYAYVAKHITRGKLLYKEIWDHKPPLIHLIYAAVLNIFIPTIKSIRIFKIIIVIFTLLLLYLLTKKMFGDLVALVAGLFFGFYSGNIALQGYTANCEPFVNFFIVLSLVLFFYIKDKKWGVIASGITGGLGFLVKQNGGVVLLIVVLFLLIDSIKNRNWQKNIKKVILYILGFLLPFSLVLLYFLSKEGLKDFIYSVFIYNMFYMKIREVASRYYLWRIFQHTFLLLFLSLLGLIILLSKQYGEKRTWFILLWLFFSYLAVAAGGKYFPHYFIQLIPIISILAALGVEWVVFVVDRKKNWKIVLLLILFLIQFIYIIVETKTFHCFGLTRNKLWLKTCGLYLQQNTPKDETIYVWGIDTELYLLAKRDCPSRYFYIQPIIANTFTARQSITKEIMGDFNRKPPFYFVNAAELSFLPEVMYNFLRANYIWEKDFGPLRLYKRKDKV